MYELKSIYPEVMEGCIRSILPKKNFAYKIAQKYSRGRYDTFSYG